MGKEKFGKNVKLGCNSAVPLPYDTARIESSIYKAGAVLPLTINSGSTTMLFG
jgi:hypothetical protein